MLQLNVYLLLAKLRLNKRDIGIMDFKYYLAKFKEAADGLDKRSLDQKELEVSVGIVMDSVYLKLYKRRWTSDLNEPLSADARIFFSVWVNEKTIKEHKIFYNIHALKLRKLNGYSIQSRAFATDFRRQFQEYQGNWENVSTKFGPLTLMEGWTEFDEGNLERILLGFAENFLEIENLIDQTLKGFEQHAGNA